MSLLVVADSLAFHGPERGELSTHPGLYGTVAAAALGTTVDLVARRGWTARDAWWALTKDPLVYSVLLPRAEECQEERGLLPNFVAVDFYDRGDLFGVVQTLNRLDSDTTP